MRADWYLTDEVMKSVLVEDRPDEERARKVVPESAGRTVLDGGCILIAFAEEKTPLRDKSMSRRTTVGQLL